MTTDDFRHIVPSIPRQPGIYKFLDKEDSILYVGKAKNLRSRLASYFGDQKQQYHKTRVLVRNARRIEFMLTGSEQDALLLENSLIKRFQPRYNVMLKDDKSYSYICVKNERFPRVFLTRRVIRDGSTYFGPYTSKVKVKVILDIVKKLFPLRTCTYNLSEENIQKGKFRVCLEYHIKNCLGPCEGLEEEASYMDKIDQVKNILRGHFREVKDHLKRRMETHVRDLEFEKAQDIKEKLSLFEDYQAKSTVVSPRIRDVDVFGIATDEESAYVNYLKVINGAIIHTYTQELTKNLDEDEADLLSFTIPELRERFNSIAPELVIPFKVGLPDQELIQTVPQRGDKRKLLELSQKNVRYFLLQRQQQKLNRKRKQTQTERVLKTLQEDLRMNHTPFHIECFDNSNIQGSNPVAACVVFRNGKPSKPEYRHFNIKTVTGPDDFASMEEVVYRRYRRMLEEGEALPDLIVIDGGKGQLSAAMKSLRKLEPGTMPVVIGIAKRLEEIYFPGDTLPLYINKKSESLKLIQQARNEAHRFAIKFHRTKRSQNFAKSQLTDISGIGEKTAKALLSHFGSVEKVKKASYNDLFEVIGKAAAEKVMRHFHDGSA
jgi:excinuclease ABC subunit C